MSQEQKLKQIIERLFDITAPGTVKSSLWQAYQQASKERRTFEDETEQACTSAAEQAAHDMPYVEVAEARPPPVSFSIGPLVHRS